MHPTVIFRTSLFQRYPLLRYPIDYPRAEDYAFWLQIVSSTQLRIDNLPGPYILTLRKHGLSESSMHANVQRDSSTRALLKAFSMVESNDEIGIVREDMMRKLLRIDSTMNIHEYWDAFRLVEKVEKFLLTRDFLTPKEKDSLSSLCTQRLGEYALLELSHVNDYSKAPSWRGWLLRNPKDEFEKFVQQSKATSTLQSNEPTSDGVTIICFSKDRTFQLKEYLRTLINALNSTISVNIHVLWTASPEFEGSYKSLISMFPDVTFHQEYDFSAQLIELVQKAQKYILWGVDDVLYYNTIPLDTIVDTMSSDRSILSTILKLSPNITYCHPSNAESSPPKEFYTFPSGTLLKYDRTQCTQDWNYPFDLCGSIMHKEDVISLFEAIQDHYGIDALSHPNKLESAGDKILREYKTQISDKKHCMCMKEQILSVITVNIVQDVCKNPIYDEIDLKTMDEYFRKGYELDLDYYRNIKFNSVHIGDFKLLQHKET